MKTLRKKVLDLACEDLCFSEEEFKKALDELVHKGFLSANVISNYDNYGLTDKAFKMFEEHEGG